MTEQELRDAVRLLANWIVTDYIDHDETDYDDYWHCTRCWKRTLAYDRVTDSFIDVNEADHEPDCITLKAKNLLERLENDNG